MILLGVSTSCLVCRGIIEQVHPDFMGLVYDSTGRRVVIGCFDCSEGFKAKLQASLDDDDNSPIPRRHP